MNRIFFWSDMHLGHRNVIRLCHRNDASIYEMDTRLITAWNSVVGPNDYIWYLGDFAYRNNYTTNQDYLQRLNGHIMMLPGNHDGRLWEDKGGGNVLGVSAQGHSVTAYPALHSTRFNHQQIILCHYPLAEWEGYYRGSWHLHGHSHGNKPPIVGRYDVGADLNPRPVEFEELKDKLCLNLGPCS